MRTHRMTPARQARMRAELQAKLSAAPTTTRGRNRPVERDEVVLGKDKQRFTILVLPAEVCPPDKYGHPVPINALVEPFVDELRREYREWFARERWSKALREEMKGNGWDRDEIRELIPVRMLNAVETIAPRMPSFLGGGYRDCRHCGRTFAHVVEASRLRYCSEECAEAGKADRRKEWVEKRTAARGNVRADVSGRCLRCGEVMEANRASKRYCSGRCRVAAHREGKGGL